MTAACVVAAMSAITQSNTAADEVVLVGEALVEVPQRHPGLAADAAHRQFRQIGVGTEDVEARFQEAAAALGDAVGRFDAAVGPHLSHRVHLDTASAACRQYQETDVLTFADRGGQ